MIITENMLENSIGSFLQHSNWIEGEESREAIEDALKAWAYAEKCEVITEKEVLHIHKLLMKRLRPDIAGKWRDCDVWIGGKRKFFVSVKLLEDSVKECLVWVNAPHDHDNEEYAKRCHVMFEGIHPFEDGNGRVGRILYNWQRLKLGLPVHVIKADYDGLGANGEQFAYYQWFKEEK